MPNIELVLANAIFGISYSLLMRQLESKIPLELIFILQLMVSAAIFIPIALLNPWRRSIALRDIVPLSICAVITIYGWSLLTLKATESTSAVDIAAISTLGPTVTILAAAMSSSRLNVRRRATRRYITRQELRRTIIPIIALILVSLVILHEMPNIAEVQNIYKSSVAVTAVVCMGVSTVIISDLERSYGTTTTLAIYFAVALLLLPLLYPNFAQLLCIIPDLCGSRIDTLLLFVLPIFTMSLPLYLLLRGAQQLTPLHTALYRYIQPVIAFVVMCVESYHRSNYADLPPVLTQLATTLLLSLLLLLISSALLSRGDGK